MTCIGEREWSASGRQTWFRYRWNDKYQEKPRKDFSNRIQQIVEEPGLAHTDWKNTLIGRTQLMLPANSCEIIILRSDIYVHISYIIISYFYHTHMYLNTYTVYDHIHNPNIYSANMWEYNIYMCVCIHYVIHVCFSHYIYVDILCIYIYIYIYIHSIYIMYIYIL